MIESLTQEERFVLNCISDFIKGNKTELFYNIDKELLCGAAKKHQVEGIIYYQTKISGINDSIAKSCYTLVHRQAVHHLINNIFANNRIRHIWVKGLEIAKYYPIPSLRTMGDSDILVHETDKQRAHEILISNGFECIQQGVYEWSYCKDGLEFELHHALVYDEQMNEYYQKLFCDKAWEHVIKNNESEFSLELEYHLVFLLIHLRKHILSYGAGFRQFIDLAVISMRHELDWNKVESYVTESDIRLFAKTCFALCEHWFNIKIPYYELKEIDDNFYCEVTHQIFKNGVFGFDNSVNTINKTCVSGKKWLITESWGISLFPPHPQVTN